MREAKVRRKMSDLNWILVATYDTRMVSTPIQIQEGT